MENLTRKKESKFYASIKGGMLSYGLTATELIIYATIHGFSEGGKSLCNSSLSQFQTITGQSRSNVQKAIASLEEKKMIVSIAPKSARQNKSYYSAISRTSEDFTSSGSKAVKATDEIQVHGWMREYGLNAKQLILLALIERHSYDGRSTYTSYMPEMMAWTGLQKDANIRKNLKILEEKNAIVRIERGAGNARLYYTAHSRNGTPPKKNIVNLNEEKGTPPESNTVTPPENTITPPEKNTVTPPESNTSNINSNKFIRTAANIKKQETSKTEPAAAVFQQMIKTFGFPPDFSEDLYETLERKIPDERLRCQYIQFEFDREKGSAKDSVQYFYRTAKCENRIKAFLNFVNKQKKDEEKKDEENIDCPVCEKKFHKVYENCPECGMPVKDFKNIRLVQKQKTIRSWPCEKREDYEKKYYAYGMDLTIHQRLRIYNSAEYKEAQKAYQDSVDRDFGLDVA